jgi:hypothetical protein
MDLRLSLGREAFQTLHASERRGGIPDRSQAALQRCSASAIANVDNGLLCAELDAMPRALEMVGETDLQIL